jgi:hypothetical protein
MSDWYVAPAGSGASDGNAGNAGSTPTVIAVAAATPFASDGLLLDDVGGTWGGLGVAPGNLVCFFDTDTGDWARDTVDTLAGRLMTLTSYATTMATSTEVRVGGPLADIKNAFSFHVAIPGDTVHVRRGTYDPALAIDGEVFPSEANVSTVETAYGPTGTEYAGSLDVAAAEASAAAGQLATDQAAVLADAAHIETGTTILGQAGTLVVGPTGDLIASDGQLAATSAGGTVESLAVDGSEPFRGKAYKYRHNYTSAGSDCVAKIPLILRGGATARVLLWAKLSATGQTTRLTAKLKDANTGDTLATLTAADSSAWQTVAVELSVPENRSATLEVSGRNANGSAVWQFQLDYLPRVA